MNLIGNNFGGISPLYARPQVPVQKEVQASPTPIPVVAPEAGESVSFSQAATAPVASPAPAPAPELPAAPSPEQFIAVPPRQNPENMLAGSGIIAGHQSGSLLMIDDSAAPAAAGAISDHNVEFTSPAQLKQLRGLAQALAATDKAGLEMPTGMAAKTLETTLNGQPVTIRLGQVDDNVELHIQGNSSQHLDPKMFGQDGMPTDMESVKLPSGSEVEMEWFGARSKGPSIGYFFPKEDMQALVNYGRQLNDAAV